MRVLPVFIILILLQSCNQNKHIEKQTKEKGSTIKLNMNLKTFSWDEPTCTFTGNYDSTLYTQEQLQNTFDIGSGLSDRFMIRTECGTFCRSYYDIEQLNVDSLDAECLAKLRDLKSLNIVNKPYWIEIKKKKIIELEMEYKFSRLMIIGFQYPDTLSIDDCPRKCYKYVDALVSGGDKLIKVWKELKYAPDASGKANPYSIKDYEEKVSTEDKYLHAQIDVMLYGWWNTVNEIIPRVDALNFQVEFAKLFTDVTSECEDAD